MKRRAPFLDDEFMLPTGYFTFQDTGDISRERSFFCYERPTETLFDYKYIF